MDGVARTILHLDMDAFFAAIEQLDHPEWRGKPLVVGSPPDQRGVVSTASYEARVFGVHSAMPSRTAGRLCPHGIFVPPRMERYEEVSGQVMAIIGEFTPLVEQVSVDEAFMDVRGAMRIWPDPIALARELKGRIRERLQLTGSVGVATNKYLAKVASDLQKPDGLTVVPVEPDAIVRFLAPLPATKIWGIGKVSGARLAERGIRTIGQVQDLDERTLESIFGRSMARHVWELARGIDDRAVETGWDEKSISGEYTFGEDCRSLDTVRQVLLEQVERVGARMREAGKVARTAQIKVRFGDFTTITRQAPLPGATNADRALMDCAFRLFERERIARPIRLIGFGVSNLAPASADGGAPAQSELFGELDPLPRRDRDQRLDQAVDRLRQTFGRNAVRRGAWQASDGRD